MNESEAIRAELVEYLQRQLVGPSAMTVEALTESPTQRYISGILFPQKKALTEIEDASPDAAATGDSGAAASEAVEASEGPEVSGKETPEVSEELTDEAVRLANTYYPSALGLSFLIPLSARRLTARVSGAVYQSREVEKEERKLREWLRVPFELEQTLAVSEKETDFRTLPLRPDLHLVWTERRVPGRGVLATAVIVNPKTATGDKGASASDCVFQARLEVHGDDAQTFLPYRGGDALTDDPEETELQLLYRNRRVYAVGHGCATDWTEDAGACRRVSTSNLPVVRVPPVVPSSDGGSALSMQELGGLGSTAAEQVPDLLESIPSAYAQWIEQQRGALAQVEPRLRQAADDNLKRCEIILQRVRDGISLLRRSSKARDAFVMANRAMLMQQYHSRLPRRLLTSDANPVPTYVSGEKGGNWRTFQIAFLLMNVGAFGADAEAGLRETVDLIWFPTGGGKTEAYLGLIAYAIFRERLDEKTRGGCVAIMRYTLRLLTANQFQRASALICACEQLRRRDEARLGIGPITIGLWAGQSVSPNSNQDALAAARSLAKPGGRNQDRIENPFQLLSCPWCGTQLDAQGARCGYQPGGNPRTVLFICPEATCQFSSVKGCLPVTVVDEAIYDQPPTLLIGTVDKFAMLTWQARAGSIFNLPPAAGRRPPSLIIQDELHLISGPLGSMVGLYEAAVEALAWQCPMPPKIVASTATIRRAASQVLALYGRDKFVQFPPPGLDASDSFFARESQSSPGRLYLGVFPSAAPSAVTALVRTASAILQGVLAVPLPAGGAEGARDPYWTLIQYFNSLRELGRAATLVEADIPEYIAVMRRRDGGQERKVRRWAELTSRLNQQEIPERLEELRVTHPATQQKPALDTVLATNMISVGVDVDRLGLMLVAGQPKSTSEYIQATSRVGRKDTAPGLVVTLFNSGKPRDRSHFEQFRAFHDAFYRFVEPTSVTPFSIPALDRALHAVLVIMARHLLQLTNPQDVGGAIARLDLLRDTLAKRCAMILPGDPDAARYLVDSWNARLQTWMARNPKRYGSPGPVTNADVPLMYMAGSSAPEEVLDNAWPTMTSMRSVESECPTRIVQMPVGGGQ